MAIRWNQMSVTAGYAGLICGVAAVALERPWPTSDAAGFPAFLADNRGAILAQSMLFLLGAAFFMWFLGSLRSFLIRSEAGSGRVASIAFVAGMIGYGLNVLAQAPQITLTLPDRGWIDPATAAMITDLGYVMLVIANVPLAVMYAAIATVSLRDRAFPAWLGWLAVFAAVAAATLTLAVIDPTGPLAPQGWLSYVLYMAPIAWLLPATTVMFVQLGRQSTEVRHWVSVIF